MDPDNYYDYGGVDHAEYCFQVNLYNLIMGYPCYSEDFNLKQFTLWADRNFKEKGLMFLKALNSNKYTNSS